MANKFKLMSATAIKSQQDKIAKNGMALLAMIRENADQCLAHFKEHGDITLSERLLASLPPGMVVAGLAKWFKDHAPVKFDRDGKAEVTGNPKDTKLEEAMSKDWTQDASVKNRAEKPIEPFSPALIKQRFASMVGQLKKAAEAGGRGFAGDTPEEREATRRACENLVNKTILIMNNVDLTTAAAPDVLKTTAKVSREVPGTAKRISKRGAKQAEGKAVSEAA